MSNNSPQIDERESGGHNESIPAESFTVVDLAAPAFSAPRTRTVVVEDLLKPNTTKLGPCQVGSKTDRPCPRQAVVELRGVLFCEQCARGQEAYFAIGEMSLN